MDDLGESNKLCLEALARVLESCSPDGSGGGGGAAAAMPAWLGGGQEAGPGKDVSARLLPFLNA